MHIKNEPAESWTQHRLDRHSDVLILNGSATDQLLLDLPSDIHIINTPSGGVSQWLVADPTHSCTVGTWEGKPRYDQEGNPHNLQLVDGLRKTRHRLKGIVEEHVDIPAYLHIVRSTPLEEFDIKKKHDPQQLQEIGTNIPTTSTKWLQEIESTAEQKINSFKVTIFGDVDSSSTELQSHCHPLHLELVELRSCPTVRLRAWGEWHKLHEEQILLLFKLLNQEHLPLWKKSRK